MDSLLGAFAVLVDGARKAGENHSRMAEPIICQKAPVVQQVEPGEYWWCACGRSKEQPFCDGSHKGTDLGPKKVTIDAAGTVAWCMCKHSGDAPYCDGTHSRLK